MKRVMDAILWTFALGIVWFFVGLGYVASAILGVIDRDHTSLPGYHKFIKREVKKWRTS